MGVREQFPDVVVRMDPGLEHGGFLMPLLPGWLAQCHAAEILRFLNTKASLSHTASSPGRLAREATDFGLPLRRMSGSVRDLQGQVQAVGVGPGRRSKGHRTSG